MRGGAQPPMSYQIKLEIFEGPMDLLLHLIKKHELNVYDIPIALITQQYLEYLDIMKSLDMEIAGEFLVMASTLTHIKSKMLLPPPENPEADDDGIDPRAELIRRLLEYKSFKDAASSLENKEETWSRVYTRPGDTAPELHSDDEPLLFDFHLFDLLSALKDVIARVPDARFEITTETVSITEKISQILARLEAADSILFADLFEGSTSKMQVIGTFLALLELIKTRVVKAFQIEQFGAIRIMKAVMERQDKDIATGNLFG
ncbi:MAG TPA: segregation/condensation protein A, partial [Nitrospirota bacterium]|nr:segregation/condensation protein A [Nitrospirota bacterium]